MILDMPRDTVVTGKKSRVDRIESCVMPSRTIPSELLGVSGCFPVTVFNKLSCFTLWLTVKIYRSAQMCSETSCFDMLAYPLPDSD